MLKIEEELHKNYNLSMKQRFVPNTEQCHYLKWLSYYLDFCFKYSFSREDNKSLKPFIEKLKQKKQSQVQQDQAKNAVELFYSMLLSEKSHKIQASKSIPALDFKGNTKSGRPKNLSNGFKQEPNSTEYATELLLRIDQKVQEAITKQDITKISSNEISSTSQTGASWVSIFTRINDEVKLRHYSQKTLKVYRLWVQKFQSFTHSKAPSSLTTVDVKEFLTFLAVKKGVAASTQNQAFNALLFLFRNVLGKDFGKVDGVVRAKRSLYIPVVLSREEINAIFSHLEPPCRLVAKFLYGCGLRLFECLQLRLQDLNFTAGVLTVHDGKGKKDRTVPIPETIVPEIKAHIKSLKEQHQQDLRFNYSYPKAAKEFPWQWLFPAANLTQIPETNEWRRYHLHETIVQKAIKIAVNNAGICKRASAHTFRHSFASHLLQANYDIRTIQELLGHSDVKTTMIYTHTVKSITKKEAKSPLDFE
ncbi:MAG: integron integrase [Candidatus Riflebacteria bacterium]|nr:integron integrase [Candidatus Riflebacteria bacterium]